MENQERIMVSKVTLTSKKVVLVREPTVEDIELSTQVAGSQAKDNDAYLGMLLQKEMLKKLVVQIDEKVLTNSDKEQISKFFTLAEYGQISNFISTLMGTQDQGNFQSELVSFGSK